MTLRRKLLFWYTGVFAISGCALMVALYLFTAHQLRREAEKFLRDESVEWLNICNETLPNLSKLEAHVRDRVKLDRYFPLTFRLYDEERQQELLYVGHPRLGNRPPTKEEIPERVGEVIFSRHIAASGGREFRLLTMRLESNDHPGIIMQTGVYIRRLNHRLSLLRIFLGASVGVTIGLSLVGGLFLAGKSLRPMDEIVSHLQDIESQNLSYRLSVPETHDEVEQLRRTINRMLERLENTFERVQGFTADAAHELRTPLAGLQCQMEVALNKARTPEEYQSALGDALSEVSALTRIVNDLLFLARIDAGGNRTPSEKVSLPEVLGEVVDVFGIAAQQKGIRLTLNCDKERVIPGDRGLLRQLFGNLIDNALRHTDAGGSVEIQVSCTDSACEISVADTGIGIPKEMQGKIFDRFFQIDSSRAEGHGGTGLGLSICRSITELHRGKISVESEPGKGSRFVVQLPV